MGQLVRQLNLYDIIFSGYGYTVGADIFALIPYIVRNAKGYTWLAFLIGGLLSLATGLSYARLNIDYPSNDAEYTWIKESFQVKEEKTDKDKLRNQFVSLFSAIVIWAVMILGVTMNSVMVVSMGNFIKKMGVNIPDKFLNFAIVLIPTLFNFLDVKKMSVANIIVTIITSVTLFGIPFLSLFKNPFSKDLKPTEIKKDTLMNIVKAIGITILPYNGYQSVVQMSEETKDVSDIPKGMLISGVLAIALYTLLSVGVISILGIKNISSSKSPISEAFSLFFGSRGGDIVNVVAVLTGFTTLLLSLYSRSRLLSKLSELKIAPELFSNYGVKVDENNTMFKGIPFYSIIVISIMSYVCTLFREDSLEILTDITNILTFFVFICVNFGVIYNYFKKKDNNQNEENKENKENNKMTSDEKLNEELNEEINNDNEENNSIQNLLDKITSSFPIYAFVGIVILSLLLYQALKEFFN